LPELAECNHREMDQGGVGDHFVKESADAGIGALGLPGLTDDVRVQEVHG